MSEGCAVQILSTDSAKQPFSHLSQWKHWNTDSNTLPEAPCFVNTEKPFLLKVYEECEHKKAAFLTLTVILQILLFNDET